MKTTPLALVLAAFAAPALAQQDAPADGAATRASDRPAIAPAASSPWSVSVSGAAFYTGKTDLDDGEVEIWRAGAGIDAVRALDSSLRLSFGFSYEFSSYNFSGTGDDEISAGQDADDILDEAHTLVLSAMLHGQADEDWGWFVGAALASGFESSASFGDSLYGGLTGGFTYRVSDRLTIGAGVAVSTDIADDDLFVFPFPIIRYQITERLRIGTEEAGLVLAYQHSEALELSLRAGFERRQYAIDGEGRLDDGAVIDSRIPVSFGVAYRPSRRLELAGFVGAYVWSEFEFQDEGGDEVADEDADPAFFTGLSLTLRF